MIHVIQQLSVANHRPHLSLVVRLTVPRDISDHLNDVTARRIISGAHQ